MRWKQKTASVAAVLACAAGGVVAGAAPAQADGPCPSGALCIWDQTSFQGNRILTRSTNACYRLGNYTFFGVDSYDSNLPVNGYIWHWQGGANWTRERTLVSGGFSSNIGVPGLGALPDDYLCMGSATPP
ncbi:proteinase inhibitor I36 SMPI [Actinomadura sp. KC06]|uniref:peptidase inhibitor family I36 protein n=1 Tax=Actinomadura sp. KC06 TaxID=2530369 RepID=UPI0010474D1A|nr:peptidase inhibitor family I36 protein [Actinomadura sp. KC06]TDD28980.1 proteinase inhibitor I36 SMPI [Actinomadura sp. KC06]